MKTLANRVKMSVRRINIAAILSVSVATFSSSAYAEIVTFYFEGPVGYYVDPDCPSDLGNFVTGSVTFDTSTSPTSLSPVRNAYYDAVTSFNFSTNGVDGVSRTYNCGHAQTWDDWSETKDLLAFTCEIEPGHYYHLGTFGEGMLASLDLPTQPPAGERIDFHWSNTLCRYDISSNDIRWVLPATTVAIDIKPGNKRNTINPWSRGIIWVAILSDAEFDSLQIDIPTVRFGPDEARAIRHREWDVNRDGLDDLVLLFKIPETGISCGDTEATLAGATSNGQPFTGADTITTVWCWNLDK